jgi:hypothetical protein
MLDCKECLLELLGLPATASDPEIKSAMDDVATHDDVMALQNRNAALETEHAAIIENDLNELGITDAAQREVLRPALLANRSHALAAIKGLKPAATPAAPLYNRATAGVPNTSADSLAKPGEEERAKRIKNRASQIVRDSKGKTQWKDAWRSASAEIPEEKK